MAAPLRWLITTVVGAVVFGLTWWICQSLARLDIQSAIGVATVATTIVGLPLAWWSGRDSPGQPAHVSDDVLTANRSRILNRVDRYEFRSNEAQWRMTESFDLDVLEDPQALGTAELERGFSLPYGRHSINQVHQLFADSDGALLVLGPAGSGKSTLLRILLKSLLDAAERNKDTPIPFLLDLTSWKDGKGVSEWLTEELRSRYDLPEGVISAVMASENIVLLLDALDVLPLRVRNHCTEALSRFRAKHGFTSLAVACRKAEYDELTTLPRLRKAVVLQPLSRELILMQIRNTGDLRVALEKGIVSNPGLLDLLSLPLALTLVVHSVAVDANDSATNLENYQGVVQSYLKIMLTRAEMSSRCSPSESFYYLRWIAEYLQSKNLSSFRVDHLQPSDLRKTSHQFIAHYGLAVPVFVLSWAAFGALATLSTGTAHAILAGALAALTVTFISAEDRISLQDPYRFTLIKSSNILKRIGFTGFLLSGLSILFGLVSAYAGWLLQLILTGTSSEARHGAIAGAAAGCLLAVAGALLMGVLTVGLPDESGIPNQAVWRTGKHAVAVGIGTSCLYGAVISIILPPDVAVFAGLWAGVIATMGAGGRAFLQHFVVRFLLSRSDFLPYRLVAFLNAGVNSNLLVRVGSSYEFIHALVASELLAPISGYDWVISEERHGVR